MKDPRRHAASLSALALVLGLGCSDETSGCEGTDPLRCRVERADDPEVREALAPFLDSAAPAAGDGDR